MFCDYSKAFKPCHNWHWCIRIGFHDDTVFLHSACVHWFVCVPACTLVMWRSFFVSWYLSRLQTHCFHCGCFLLVGHQFIADSQTWTEYSVVDGLRVNVLVGPCCGSSTKQFVALWLGHLVEKHVNVCTFVTFCFLVKALAFFLGSRLNSMPLLAGSR